MTGRAEMVEAVANHATRAAEKLRRHQVLAPRVAVFMHTSPFAAGPHYSASTSQALIEPSADTLEIVGAAVRCAERLFRPGYRYAKAGVVLDDLAPLQAAQAALWPPRDRDRSARLMEALDAVNARHGRRSLFVARAGVAAAKPKGWELRADRKSPRYTTRMDELPIARADARTWRMAAPA